MVPMVCVPWPWPSTGVDAPPSTAEPVVVVVEGPAAEVAAVVGLEDLVGVADPGIDVGHHHPVPVNAQAPHLVGVDVGDVGLDGAALGVAGLPLRGLDHTQDPSGAEDLDLLKAEETVEDIGRR